ncbi:MAG: glycerophosphodiester phosphodiesterase family protein, partial [Rikenellaceae bacterium]
TINRTTTGKGKIEDMTLQEILSYNIVDKYGNETEFKIPTLDELLGFVAGRTKVLIEIKRRKNQYPGLEEAMIELIKKHNAQEWVTVQSFNDSALENTHSLMPEIALEKLFVFRLCGLPYIFDGTFAGFSADKYKHIDSFNIYYRSASKRLVESIHKMGKKVKLWSIKDNNTKIPDVGADGIITDRPDQW